MSRLTKLALMDKILCRLVWLTDFLEIQSPKGDICYKKQNIEKNQTLCTFVAFFLLKY